MRRKMEREMGFEPTTPTLATWCSTTELLPPEQPSLTDQVKLDRIPCEVWIRGIGSPVFVLFILGLGFGRGKHFLRGYPHSPASVRRFSVWNDSRRNDHTDQETTAGRSENQTDLRVGRHIAASAGSR